MRNFTQTGICRILLAFSICLLFGATAGHTATIHWEALPDRERISIQLTPEDARPSSADRVAVQALSLAFDATPSGLQIPATPAGATLFKAARVEGQKLVVDTQTPEFGFMLSKPRPDQVVIDIFSDPLGARWKPAPQPTAANSVRTEAAIVPQNGQTPVTVPTIETQISPTVADSAPASPEGALAQNSSTNATSPASIVPPATQKGPAIVSQNQPEILLPQTAQESSAQPEKTAKGDPTQTRPEATTSNAAAPGTNSVEAKVTPSENAKTELAADAASGKEAPVPETSAALDTENTEEIGEPGLPVQTFTPLVPYLDTRRLEADQEAALPAPEPPAPDYASVFRGKTKAVPEAQPGQPSEQSGARPEEQTGQVGKNGQTGQTEQAGQSPSQNAAAAPPDLFPGKPAQNPQPATPGSVRGQINLNRRPATGEDKTAAAIDEQSKTAEKPEDASSMGDQAQTPILAPRGFSIEEPQDTSNIWSKKTGVLTDLGLAYRAKARERSPEDAVDEGVAASASEPVTVYVNEEGKRVRPPADPDERLKEIVTLVDQRRYFDALEMVEPYLRQPNLGPEHREQALHIRAEMIYNLNKDKLADKYREIIDSTTEALNFNYKSKLNAAALMRLGYVNLKLNNIPEATARFNMLRRQFPDDPNIPLTYYYWGDYYYNTGDYLKAADEFQHIVQNYPESDMTRESALALARSFYQLGFNEQAFNVAEYIQMRWPRFYLEHPPFLSLLGDIAMRLDKRDTARENYWLYYNTAPNSKDADIILTRIGDLYALDGQTTAARSAYKEAVRRFPNKDGGLVALMRLAEQGVNDDPSAANIDTIFSDSEQESPASTYLTIINDHPQSPLVPLAQLKLAMWYLWDKQYINAIETCTDLVNKYPDSELAPRAKEVALHAFTEIGSESLQDERLNQLAQIWEKYAIINQQNESLAPETRISLAYSYWKSGQPQKALVAIDPLFMGPKVQKYSEMALALALTIYLEHGQWPAVNEVARRVELWELTPKSQLLLKYARALVAENMNQPEVAAPLWEELYMDVNLPSGQSANAAFFVARNAEKNRDMKKAWNIGRDALSRLLSEATRDPQKADNQKVMTLLGSLMDIAEASGRYTEAMEYAAHYINYLPKESPERASVLYRTARITKRQGNEEGWRRILVDISVNYPDTVYGQTAAAELKNAKLTEDAARFAPSGSM